MKATKYYAFLGLVPVSLALTLVLPATEASASEPDSQFVVASSMLSGLAPKAVFPFIDSTPHTISSAHIAITDDTASCSGSDGSAPSSVQVLVGQAGVSLVPVMDASTNTGISLPSGQCVFHVTIHAGQNGVPGIVTDIVVLNAGTKPLSGVNTVTASATVHFD